MGHRELPADELPNVVATVRSLHPWSTPSWQKHHGLTAAEVERTREAIGEVLSDVRVRTREELGAAVAERVRSWGTSSSRSMWRVG